MWNETLQRDFATAGGSWPRWQQDYLAENTRCYESTGCLLNICVTPLKNMLALRLVSKFSALKPLQQTFLI